MPVGVGFRNAKTHSDRTFRARVLAARVTPSRNVKNGKSMSTSDGSFKRHSGPMKKIPADFVFE